jgi:hypothetical protein
MLSPPIDWICDVAVQADADVLTCEIRYTMASVRQLIKNNRPLYEGRCLLWTSKSS